MDMDVSRAIEYILSDELEQSKQNTSKWVLSSFKHFTRSKSQRKKGSERSPSRNSSTGAIDDDEEEQLRLAVEMSLQPQSSDVIFPEDAPKAPPPSVSPPRSNSPYFGPARRPSIMNRSGGWFSRTRVSRSKRLVWLTLK